MKNIFRFLAKHKLAILAAICCLVVQAYCDLALPTYTSDVLNVGLQQGGIADGVMDTVRADSLETLTQMQMPMQTQMPTQTLMPTQMLMQMLTQMPTSIMTTIPRRIRLRPATQETTCL